MWKNFVPPPRQEFRMLPSEQKRFTIVIGLLFTIWVGAVVYMLFQ